jgi:hypothetical protein
MIEQGRNDQRRPMAGLLVPDCGVKSTQTRAPRSGSSVIGAPFSPEDER